MTDDSRKTAEHRLKNLLAEQPAHSMPAADLIRNMTKAGTPEMDAREALLSLMVRGDVDLTSDWQVRALGSRQ